MKALNTAISGNTLLALIACAAVLGCSKNSAPQSPPAAVDAAASTEQPAPQKPESITSTRAPQLEQWLGDAQNYQKTGDYDKAAQCLIAIQQQQRFLSEQQAAAYWSQMSAFQSGLAARVAAGDPKAKAAAERLRASTMR